MTKEEKEHFEYWLTNNMYINKATADTIIAHVERYFEAAQSLLSEKWVSVEERLPEVDNSKSDFGERVQCLVVYDGSVWIGYFSNFGRPHWSIPHIHSSESLKVTAWQPLPSPPTK